MRRLLLENLRRALARPCLAVYFRKSNPPEQDWAHDHQTAARIGMNTFRHWFMWSAIEVAPGQYHWRDYDRMMDPGCPERHQGGDCRVGNRCSRMGVPKVRSRALCRQ